eukprot:g65709.t1
MEAEQIVRAHREAERRKTDAEGVRQAHLDQIKFQVGDIVLLYHPQVPKGVSSKLFTHWKGPYQIMEQTGPLNYKIRDQTEKFNTVTDYLRFQLDFHMYRSRSDSASDGSCELEPRSDTEYAIILIRIFQVAAALMMIRAIGLVKK